jgi:hypothetical protein
MRTNRIMSSVAAAVLVGAVGLAPLANAQVTEHREVTTEKTTTYSGMVSEIQPSSSTIVMRSESSPDPVRYTYTKNTTFVDANGNVVSQETIKNSPVTVTYVKDGDQMVVTKVVQTRPAAMMMEKKTTTTEEHSIH